MKGNKLLFIVFLVVFSMVLTSMSPSYQPIYAASDSEGNDYPIILVHGLAGWGEGEMLDVKYWGGESDIESYLSNNGHTTLTATVGPVSSNWDRAIELYYYIKGGTVDYGAKHAEEHGHERFGRTYPGIYPEWDGKSKIHLIGHSMGGLTIRLLNELLVNGAAEEIAYAEEHPDMEVAPLFQGGNDWVHSITSVATPHNGSTFANDDEKVPFIKELVLNFASLSGVNQDNLIYDFKLDHWGLKRQSGERFRAYMDRVMNSSIWDSDDISVYDLTTEGAAKLNERAATDPNVYYFSYTGDATYKGQGGKYYPLLSMNPFMWDASIHMGSYTNNDSNPVVDESWWPNDGLVNVISGKYPLGHDNKPFDQQNIQKGVWNHHQVNYAWDHLDYIGLSLAHGIGIREVNRFYLKMAEQLHELPE